MSNQQDAIIGGCTRTTLIEAATSAGKRFRNAVKRGDFRSAYHAWATADHGVGYPYMTCDENAAAEAAFVEACR